MKKTIVYTACFGNKDTIPNPIYFDPQFDYICFTDNKDCVKSDVWKIILCDPLHEDPRMSAKIFKILPHLFLNEYDYSIWQDANLIQKTSILPILDMHPANYSLLVFDNHMKNFNLNEEIGEHLKRNRCSQLLMAKQYTKYVEDGFPEDLGNVIFPAIMFRKHKDEKLQWVMNMWWKEIVNNSPRDMISWPYVQWKMQFEFYKRLKMTYTNYYNRNSHTILNNHEPKSSFNGILKNTNYEDQIIKILRAKEYENLFTLHNNNS